MRCEETHALLFAYMDQKLDVLRHMEMADHLATCPQCTRAYTAQQAVQSALRTAHALFHRRCFWQALRKVPCSALPWAPAPSPPWRVLLLRTERPSSATAATRPAGRHHSGPRTPDRGQTGDSAQDRTSSRDLPCARIRVDGPRCTLCAHCWMRRTNSSMVLQGNIQRQRRAVIKVWSNCGQIAVKSCVIP